MMPQKRNPDMLELIRGRCGNVYGDLVALMTILKGLPIGYNRDLQEDKRHVFAAFDVTSASLAMAAAIVSSARYVRANIEPTLDRGFLDATSLAEYFVTAGDRVPDGAPDRRPTRPPLRNRGKTATGGPDAGRDHRNRPRTRASRQNRFGIIRIARCGECRPPLSKLRRRRRRTASASTGRDEEAVADVSGLCAGDEIKNWRRGRWSA